MESEAEFMVALSIYGGIILAGTLVVIGLVMLGFGIKNRMNKDKLTNEIYEQKERSNGKH